MISVFLLEYLGVKRPVTILALYIFIVELDHTSLAVFTVK